MRLLTLFLAISGALAAHSATPVTVPARPVTAEAASAAVAVFRDAPVSSYAVFPAPAAITSADFAAEGSKDALIGLFSDADPVTKSSAVLDDPARWWEAPTGEQVYTIGLHASGAFGLRVEVERLVLPAGAYAAAFSVDPGAPPEGPFQSSAFWTPTLSGEEVRLQLILPPGAAVEGVVCSIPRLGYLFRDPVAVAKSAQAAGPCNLDARCHPAWQSAADSVCGLGIISQNGILFCTGALIADADPCSSSYYVLTANHCVAGQAGFRGADTVEFYWHYQTPSCNGAPPSLLSLPRTTGGADYLAGDGGRGDSGGGNDFTLLRLRNAPPVTALQAGYSTAIPDLNAPVVALHHPRGEWMRISFGAISNVNNVYAQDYHEVVWNDGTTEPGSSGSPLFLAGTAQIIGQLWGGGASCAALLAPDYYGRFDVTFPGVKNFIGPREPVLPLGSMFVSEGAGTINIQLDLSRPAGSSAVTLDYALVPVSASPADFLPASGQIVWPPTAHTATFALSILDDSHAEQDETIEVQVTNPACASLPPEPLLITIIDNDADTDGDGISDTDELAGAFGPPTDPNSPDSDQDGLRDDVELLGLNGFVTNPNAADTDGDGLEDQFEVLIGLDPTLDEGAPLHSLSIPWFQ